MTEGADNSFLSIGGMEFHHIGVIAQDIDYACNHMSLLFGVRDWSKVIEDPEQGVNVVFGKSQNSLAPLYEIVSPLHDNSPVSKLLAVKKNIINHVAYLSNDFDGARSQVRKLGCLPVTQPKLAVAFGGARICFYLSPMGFVFEIIEKIN